MQNLYSVDCEVSQWTDWAPCSKTCGFGTRTRRRYVAQKPQKKGNACPPLVEDELCGTMRQLWMETLPVRISLQKLKLN